MHHFWLTGVLMPTVFLCWRRANAELVPNISTPSLANNTRRTAPLLVANNATTANSWILLRGFTCAKQTDRNEGTHPSDDDLGNESEDACVQACASLGDCQVAQWLDLSRLSDTGNQRFCSLYSDYDSCYIAQASYFEINSQGTFVDKRGKYCSLISDGKPAINRPALVFPIDDLEKGNSSTPGFYDCQADCVRGIFDDDGDSCLGFNYLPHEVYSVRPGETQIMPCWLFFTQKCEREMESRIFFKAFNARMSNEARQVIGRYRSVTDADITVVIFQHPSAIFATMTTRIRISTAEKTTTAKPLKYVTTTAMANFTTVINNSSLPPIVVSNINKMSPLTSPAISTSTITPVPVTSTTVNVTTNVIADTEQTTLSPRILSNTTNSFTTSSISSTVLSTTAATSTSLTTTAGTTTKLPATTVIPILQTIVAAASQQPPPAPEATRGNSAHSLNASIIWCLFYLTVGCLFIFR